MYLYNITFSVLFVGFSAFAAETDLMSKFPTLQECNAGFASAKDKAAGDTVSSYCSTHVMNDIEICIAPKVKAYVFENKLGLFSNMTNSEQLSLITKKKFECQKDAQKVTMTADQQRRADDAKKAATALVAGGAVVAGGAAAAAGATGAGNSLQNAQTALALTQQGVRVNEAIDKRTTALEKAAGTSATGATTAQSTAAPATTEETKALEASRASSQEAFRKDERAYRAEQEDTGARTFPVSSQAGSNITTTTNPDGSTTQTVAMPDGTSMVLPPLIQVPAETAAAQTVVGAETSAAAQAMPEAQDAVAALQKSTGVSPTAAAPKSPLTEASSQKSEVLSTSVTNAQSAATGALSAGPFPFLLSQNALRAMDAKVKAYIAAKQTCSSVADKASMLCIEGTSPGSIAAKELMNAAGPIISIIASAQKTCSTTAKVTKLVNTGLTIAKGVCVAAKITCDSTCGSTVKDLTTMNSTGMQSLEQTINADITRVQGLCAELCAESMGTGCAACQAQFNTGQTAAITAMNAIGAALKVENVPATPGTSPAIALGCQGFAKDIALFAIQALGTFAASQNAQKCADQLAGTTGSKAITTVQYCEKTENASQQLCVCQRTPMATGCPQAVVASTATTKTDEKGNSIQSANGNSAFGGGFKNVAPKSAFGNTKLDSNGNPLPAGAAGSETGSGGASAGNVGGGSGSGSGSGGSANAPAGSADEKTIAKEADKKKWNFGSFGGGGGGFFGGGSGSGAAKSSGTLGQKQQEAIKRQLASEQISAEVSSASGKSNWEKVRNMYLIKENSFILGQ